MALSDDILADLDQIMDDWGDSFVMASTTYSCLFDQEFVELNNVAGWQPVLTVIHATVGEIPDNTEITLTSPINGYTNKTFKVRTPMQQADGTRKYLLEEV